MEQEVRTNDMWTMISNYIEQPAIQNSQNNNNNSNPLTTIRSNSISNESAILQTVNLPENPQVLYLLLFLISLQRILDIIIFIGWS